MDSLSKCMKLKKKQWLYCIAELTDTMTAALRGLAWLIANAYPTPSLFVAGSMKCFTTDLIVESKRRKGCLRRRFRTCLIYCNDIPHIWGSWPLCVSPSNPRVESFPSWKLSVSLRLMLLLLKKHIFICWRDWSLSYGHSRNASASILTLSGMSTFMREEQP